MRPGLRLILLLILAIALRGFAGSALAMPLMQPLTAISLECADHAEQQMAATTAHHAGDSKACQISCDQAAAPALPVFLPLAASVLPAVLTPTLPALTIGPSTAPDHPPPIA